MSFINHNGCSMKTAKQEAASMISEFFSELLQTELNSMFDTARRMALISIRLQMMSSMDIWEALGNKDPYRKTTYYARLLAIQKEIEIANIGSVLGTIETP
jgi:hypothetical protein